MSQPTPHPKSGEATVHLLARPQVILRVLLRQAAVFLILLTPPLLGAMVEGAWPLVVALGLPAMVVVVAHLVGRGRQIPEDLRRVEAVLALVFVFLLSCVLTYPAFRVLGLAPIDAMFEATSAVTTTGLSVAAHADGWPLSAHLLRGWMQWCGGLVIAIAGIALLLDPGQAARALGRVNMDEGGLPSSTRAHARELLRGYLALTVFGICGAFLLIPGYWEGPVLALAAVSTGGFAPRADSLASYPLAGQVFVVLLSNLGAVSLLFYVIALRRGPGAAWRASTVRDIARLFVVTVLIYAVIHIIVNGSDPMTLVRGLLNALSCQSTTGFTVQTITGQPSLMLILIALMVVGGAIGSSAGGLKVDRVRLLARIIRLVVFRLASPARAVTYLKLDGETVPGDRILYVAALGAVYLIAAFVLWIIFAAAGHAPLAAFFDIISALSTVGVSSGVVGPDLAGPLKLLIVLAMLLGRLEFFGLIILFLPQTWIKRS